MARARNIKPAFFKNEVLAELPMDVRMLFVGLWTLADREGRLEDRPRRIKGDLFAYDSFDIDPMLNQLQTNQFIVRYEVEGERFIQVENFVKHQDPHYKERASEIPAPQGKADLIKATGVTRGQRARIIERDDYKCQVCSATTHLCIDHIIPASRGGDSSDDNLQVLCHTCNTKKGNKLDGEASGVKKGKHNSTSVLTRTNVESNLNVRKHVTPSDSGFLTPDSGFLTPDSINTRSPTYRPEPDGFAVWWDSYRRKDAKQDAVKAWKALKPDAAMQAVMLSALARWPWAKDRLHIPLPATWLRGKRWEDEAITGSIPAESTGPQWFEIAGFPNADEALNCRCHGANYTKFHEGKRIADDGVSH